MDSEENTQAVVVANTFDNYFHPIIPATPIALLPVLGVPLIDYVLESLAQSGVDETILFCSGDGASIREYVKQCKDKKAIWSLSMEVQVLVSETCRSLGDVMRELDASGLVRSHFILAGINSICNVNLLPLFEKHKQTFKKDKGATMTLLYKKVCWGHKLINPEQAIFLAADRSTKRVLLHQKLKPGPQSRTLSLPMEILLNNSEVDLHQNLVDTNIAFCAPTVLPLYSDNFDYQTRDDFVRGVLMSEEVMTNSLYYVQLTGRDYAAAITNWHTYRTISRDILHHWVYPLTYATFLKKKDDFLFLGNHSYRNKSSTLRRSCTLGEDILIGENTSIEENSKINKSVIGGNCQIGQNVVIEDSHLLSGIVVKDNCVIKNSYIGDNCTIEEGAVLDNGTIIASGNKITAKSNLDNEILPSAVNIADKTKRKEEESTDWDNESVKTDNEDKFVGYNKCWEDSGSDYSSASSDDLTPPGSPVPDDTNIFLQEVIDSLARGYEEKLNCDYLILEINSSRYAYNMQLHEVNFYVVRAVLSVPVIGESKNVLGTVKDVVKYFKPVLENYIKTKTAIMHCLNAVEESCTKLESLSGKCGQVVHLLYEADIVDEDSLTEWYEDLTADEKPLAKQNSLIKFFNWLQEASEESESE